MTIPILLFPNVPPYGPFIAANRAQLAHAVVTNIRKRNVIAEVHAEEKKES